MSVQPQSQKKSPNTASKPENNEEVEQIEIVNYKEFDFNELEFLVPEKTRGGSYISRPKYQGRDLYIQTPRLICSSLIKTDSRAAVDLEFDKSHGLFYEFITSIDDFSIIQIQKQSKKWFKRDFPLDVVEEFYKTPVKMGRKNKPPSLKIKLPMSKGEVSLDIFDNKNNILNFDKIKARSKLLTVLKFNGLKFLKQQVICEWIPIQIKTFQHVTLKRKPGYLIKDSLLTDDEGFENNRKSKNNKNNMNNIIEVEKVGADTLPINNLKLSIDEVNTVHQQSENNNQSDLITIEEVENNILPDTTNKIEVVLEKSAQEPVIEEKLSEPAQKPVIEEQLSKPAQEPVIEEKLSEPAQEPVIEEQLSKPAQEPAQEPVIEEQLSEPAQEPVIEEQLSEPAQEPVIEEQLSEPAQESEAQSVSVNQTENTDLQQFENEKYEIVKNIPDINSERAKEVETNTEAALVEICKDNKDLEQETTDTTEALVSDNDSDEGSDVEDNYETNYDSYPEFDLGLDSDNLSEVDILSLNIPEKTVELENLIKDTDSKSQIIDRLENELEKRDKKIDELQNNFNDLILQISGIKKLANSEKKE